MAVSLGGRLPPESMFPAGRARYRVRFVTTAAGHRIRVVEVGPAAGDAIVLVHGWGCYSYAFRHTMPALADAGYRAAAVDLLGHGLSDKPIDRAAYALDSLAGDVRAVAESCGPGHVSLVGHSMGATIVARAAATSVTGSVRALVLIAPVGLGSVRDVVIGRLLTPEWATRAAPFFARRWAVALALRFAHSGGHGARPTAEDIDQYWAQTQFPQFAIVLRHLVHDFPWTLRDIEWLRSISSPALVLAGANDRLVSPAGAAAYARMLPHATLRLVPDAGHAVQEQRPSAINAAIVTFLQGLARS
jgi:2-hydroxy-6-oxonona-2,4-dienedioate hydrolase